ncbi:MAG: hypothetical protein R6V41_10450 [Desulfobacteraceae bacterium]
MYTTRNYCLKKTRIFALMLLCLVMAAAGVKPAHGELKIESFCRLHVEVMEVTLSMLNNEITPGEHEDALKKLYADYGTTENEYLFFMGGHDRETQDYLEANPEVQERIDSLAGRLDSALEAEQEENTLEE